jgi:N-methylhydantoinase A
MDAAGAVTTAKALTTPGQLEVGVLDAISLAAESLGLTPEELLARVEAFGHGTTQATNALIEQDGAPTGLITTQGFGDMIRLQRLMGFTAGVPVERLGYRQTRLWSRRAGSAQ